LRNILRCRRGSAAFATVVALVPLIGVVALGGEAGSWYLTKQHAQNAADAAAYSGALWVACSDPTKCDKAQDYVYKGKQFAARNAFCNAAGDPSYPGSTCASLPIGTSQTVQIDQPTSVRVRAIVSQQQPVTGLVKVFGLFPDGVNIRAQAIAEVQNPKDLCFLGLRGPSITGLTIGGSSTITGNGCGMMSNTDVKYNSTPNFSGPGWAVNAVNGCKASAGHCDVGVPHNYNLLPSTNPLHELLDTQSFNTRTAPVTPPCSDTRGRGNGNVNNGDICPSSTMLLSPNSAGGVYSDLKVNAGGTVNFAPGTYFFYNARIDFSGTVNGKDVTFVLLGNSSLSISSSATVNLSAPTNNTFSSNLSGVLIDDQATGDVTVNGNGAVKLGGAMYFPNADVKWGGTAQSDFTTCSMVVAKTLTIIGNAYLSADRGSGGSVGCVDATVAKTQVVALVE
jgi:Putative Flp pilus-assembly TadE/G-like